MFDDVTERYNPLSRFLKNKFGCKVYKVSLYAGLACPNRDGSKGRGGCIYCNPESNLPLIFQDKGIKEQLREGIEYIKRRHGAVKFISYFQHYSNTYGDAEKLKKMYEEALADKDVVGLAVSTRPDCLNPEVLNLLEEISGRTFLWLELGLQSANNKTLQFINRGHGVEEFEEAAGRVHEKGIMTCAHIILGLPGEDHDDMIKTVRFLTRLKVGGIKIHNLHILKETRLAEMFKRGEVKTLTQGEYASLVADCLERLPKHVLIHRFNSHSPKNLTVAPVWSINKLGTLNAVHDELRRRNTYQGRLSSA